MNNIKKLAIVFRTLKPMTGTYEIMGNIIPLFNPTEWEVHIFARNLDKAAVESWGAKAHQIWSPTWIRRIHRSVFDRIVRFVLSFYSFDLVWGHGDTTRQDILSLHNCVHRVYEEIHHTPIPQRSVAALHTEIFKKQSFKKVICNSKQMKLDIQKRFAVAPDKLEVIYPGYSEKRYQHSRAPETVTALKKKWGLNPAAQVVGLVTSGDFKKRAVDRFFEVLKQLPKEKKKNIGAVVIGKEKNLDLYKKMAAQAELGGGCFFLPPAPDVDAYYSILDVMLYPCYFEEFGIAVVDAVMNRVPVVTLTSVGAAELLQGQARRFIYDQYQPDIMATGLIQILEDRSIREKVVADSIRAIQPYTWKSYFENVLKVISTCS